MDVLPFVMLLVALGARKISLKIIILLTAYSTAINLWGAHWLLKALVQYVNQAVRYAI